MNWKRTGSILSLLLLMGSTAAFGGQNNRPPGDKGSMGPPPEAYEACKDKSEGDSVEITTPRGETLGAACKQMNGKLAAVPTNMPAPPSEGASGNSQ
jgi:hypothetical protein